MNRIRMLRYFLLLIVFCGNHIGYGMDLTFQEFKTHLKPPFVYVPETDVIAVDTSTYYAGDYCIIYDGKLTKYTFLGVEEGLHQPYARWHSVKFDICYFPLMVDVSESIITKPSLAVITTLRPEYIVRYSLDEIAIGNTLYPALSIVSEFEPDYGNILSIVSSIPTMGLPTRIVAISPEHMFFIGIVDFNTQKLNEGGAYD